MFLTLVFSSPSSTPLLSTSVSRPLMGSSQDGRRWRNGSSEAKDCSKKKKKEFRRQPRSSTQSNTLIKATARLAKVFLQRRTESTLRFVLLFCFVFLMFSSFVLLSLVIAVDQILSCRSDVFGSRRYIIF